MCCTAVLKSGRAVLFPVYKGSYERGGGPGFGQLKTASDWRDVVILWVKDASRAIDFAETRPGLDRTKLAYYGYSTGAGLGAIIASVDTPYQGCCARTGRTRRRSR